MRGSATRKFFLLRRGGKISGPHRSDEVALRLKLTPDTAIVLLPEKRLTAARSRPPLAVKPDSILERKFPLVLFMLVLLWVGVKFGNPKRAPRRAPAQVSRVTKAIPEEFGIRDFDTPALSFSVPNDWKCETTGVDSWACTSKNPPLVQVHLKRYDVDKRMIELGESLRSGEPRLGWYLQELGRGLGKIIGNGPFTRVRVGEEVFVRGSGVRAAPDGTPIEVIALHGLVHQGSRKVFQVSFYLSGIGPNARETMERVVQSARLPIN